MIVEFTVGDTGPVLTFDVNASLVGATSVEVHILRPDLTVVTKTLATGVTVTDPANGLGSSSWAAGDLNQPGVYLVEVQVIFASGIKQTFIRDSSGQKARFEVRMEYA